VFRSEVTNKGKNGEVFSVEEVISPMKTSSGEITHFAAVLRDLTERKRMEDQILEASEREQRRIASDLHDGLCQELAAVAYACQALERTGTSDVEMHSAFQSPARIEVLPAFGLLFLIFRPPPDMLDLRTCVLIM